MARKYELDKAQGTELKDKSFKAQRRGSAVGKRNSVLRTNANSNEAAMDEQQEHGMQSPTSAARVNDSPAKNLLATPEP